MGLGCEGIITILFSFWNYNLFSYRVEGERGFMCPQLDAPLLKCFDVDPNTFDEASNNYLPTSEGSISEKCSGIR